jgi:SAM-dependent methyltransferase
MNESLRRLARRTVPRPLWTWLIRQTRWPRVGRVDFGSLRRLTPISTVWGEDRGLAIDRYYIERFLDANSADIRGHVLEIGDASYTRKFGGDEVTKIDVLHVEESNPEVTILADLTRADHVPSDSFDCMIVTQTLQFIYDVPAAVRHAHRLLKPGGVLLATFPGISKISRYDMDRWGNFWSFTSGSARRIFEDVFSPGNVEIGVHGNVLAAIAFLHGLGTEELTEDELNHLDPDYEVMITVRARKSEAS